MMHVLPAPPPAVASISARVFYRQGTGEEPALKMVKAGFRRVRRVKPRINPL
jgi:hypothetical protein